MNRPLPFKCKVSGFLTGCYQRAATSIIVFILPLAALGQAYRLTGKIIDEQAQPLEFVNVSLRDTVNDGFYGDVTNKEGSFSIANITQGNYQLTVSFIGFAAYKKQLNINSDTRLAAIKLSYEPAGLAEVTVTQRLPTITRKADRFVVNIEKSPILEGKDANRLLNMLPGVFITNEGNISINGIGGVKVMVNDKFLRLSGDALLSYLEGFQAVDIETVEIISNPPAEYEAEGLGGIIQIRTKKTQIEGFNGHIGGTYYQWRYPQTNGELGLNYKKGNITLYGSYSRNHRKDFTKSYVERAYNLSPISYISNEDFKNETKGYNYKFGIDYDINHNHFLGLEFNGNYRKYKDTYADIETKVFNNNVLDSIVLGTTPENRKNNNYDFNANYIWNIDTLGRKLKIITDYSIARYDNLAFYEFNYYNSDELFARSRSRRSNIQIDIDIFTVRADYIHPYNNKKSKLETGLKFSEVATVNDNFFEVFNETTNNYEINKNETNLYQYDENIYAAYLKFTSSFKKWEYNIGLRTESTQTSQNSVTQNSVVKNNYFKIFPSAFLMYNLNKKKGNSLQLYYGRRIGRPNYIVLNPFIYFTDEFTIRKGNPKLQPNFTNAFKLTYGIRNKHFISLNYYRTKDKIGDVQIRKGDLIINTFDNLENTEHWFLTAYSQFKIAEWYNIIFTVRPILSKFKHPSFSKKAKWLHFSLQNYITISPSTNIEITSRFRSKGEDRFYKEERHFFDTSIALSQKLFKGKARLNVGIDDIFYAGRGNTKSSTNYLGQDNIEIYKYGSRLFYIGFKYFFKSGKTFSKKQKEQGNQEEKNRR